MAKQVLLDGLVYAASDNSSSLFTLNLPCPMCVGGMNAYVSPRLWFTIINILFVGLHPAWVLTLVFHWSSSVISISKSVHKMYIRIFYISKSCHLIIIVITTLPSQVMWTVSKCSTSSILWCKGSATQTCKRRIWNVVTLKWWWICFRLPPQGPPKVWP